jgi:hypothetical protein
VLLQPSHHQASVCARTAAGPVPARAGAPVPARAGAPVPAGPGPVPAGPGPAAAGGRRGRRGRRGRGGKQSAVHGGRQVSNGRDKSVCVYVRLG